MDGAVFDQSLLNFKKNEPSNGGGNSFYLSTTDNGLLGDNQGQHQMFSICDMLSPN